MLGQRESDVYGNDTFETIVADLQREAKDVRGRELVARQSNHQGTLLDWLCEADASDARAIHLNTGTLSRTSVAMPGERRCLTPWLRQRARPPRRYP